jgi:hypothetical protein
MKRFNTDAKGIRCTRHEIEMLELYRQELLRVNPTMTMWQKASMADLLRSALSDAITQSQRRTAAQTLKEETCSNSTSSVPQLPLFDGPLPKLPERSTPLAAASHESKSGKRTRKSLNASGSATPPQSPRQKKRASATTPGTTSDKK